MAPVLLLSTIAHLTHSNCVVDVHRHNSDCHHNNCCPMTCVPVDIHQFQTMHLSRIHCRRLLGCHTRRSRLDFHSNCCRYKYSDQVHCYRMCHHMHMDEVWCSHHTDYFDSYKLYCKLDKMMRCNLYSMFQDMIELLDSHRQQVPSKMDCRLAAGHSLDCKQAAWAHLLSKLVDCCDLASKLAEHCSRQIQVDWLSL